MSNRVHIYIALSKKRQEKAVEYLSQIRGTQGWGAAVQSLLMEGYRHLGEEEYSFRLSDLNGPSAEFEVFDLYVDGRRARHLTDLWRSAPSGSRSRMMGILLATGFEVTDEGRSTRLESLLHEQQYAPPAPQSRPRKTASEKVPDLLDTPDTEPNTGGPPASPSDDDILFTDEPSLFSEEGDDGMVGSEEFEETTPRDEDGLHNRLGNLLSNLD